MNVATYLTQGQSEKWLHALKQLPPKQALEQVAKGVMFDFLLQQGGMSRLPIVWQEQIQTLRLTDLTEHINLHLGERASQILQCLQDAFANDQRIRLPSPDPSNGEIFFYHALYLRLRKEQRLSRYVTALRHASPLTRLCSCPAFGRYDTVAFDDGQQGELAFSYEESRAISKHPAIRYLCGDLADQWSYSLVPDPHRPATAQTERINAKRATLQLFMQSCVETGSLSILTSFPLFFQRLMQYDFVEQATRILSFPQWRMEAREELLSAYAGLLHLGTQLEEIYQREIVSPGSYGWQYPLETKVFMAKYGRLWAGGGLQNKIRDSYQHLRSQMG